MDRYVVVNENEDWDLDCGEAIGIVAASEDEALEKCKDYLDRICVDYDENALECMTFETYVNEDLDVFDEVEIESYWSLMNVLNEEF